MEALREARCPRLRPGFRRPTGINGNSRRSAVALAARASRTTGWRLRRAAEPARAVRRKQSGGRRRRAILDRPVHEKRTGRLMRIHDLGSPTHRWNRPKARSRSSASSACASGLAPGLGRHCSNTSPLTTTRNAATRPWGNLSPAALKQPWQGATSPTSAGERPGQ